MWKYVLFGMVGLAAVVGASSLVWNQASANGAKTRKSIEPPAAHCDDHRHLRSENKHLQDALRLARSLNGKLSETLGAAQEKLADEVESKEDPVIQGLMEESSAMEAQGLDPEEPWLAMAQDLDEILLEDEPDETWSHEIRKAFVQQFKNTPDANVVSSRCVRDFCRVELALPTSRSDIPLAMEQLQEMEALKGVVFVHVNEQTNPPVASIYVSQENGALPMRTLPPTATEPSGAERRG